MICFLTSSPIIPGTYDLNPANGFIGELKKCFPEECRALFICADPDIPERTDRFAADMRFCMQKAGFSFREYRVLDGRNREQAEALIRASDLLVLAGGHVPTQNRFFADIGLRGMLRGYEGIVIGISAGSMNAADIVYAQPELEGEAADPDYQRFLTGLNLTKTMILPHYQMVKDDVVDGLRVFEDIAYPDSRGKRFYALPDGSYLYVRPGKEEVRGEAYLIEDGAFRLCCSENGILDLSGEKECAEPEFLKLTAAHFEALKALQRAYKREIREDSPSDEDLDRLLPAMESGAILFYGCTVAGELAGCCSVSPGFSTFDYRRSGVFEDFYIRPEYRHRGIARNLVRFAYEHSGVSSLTVGCADCDTAMYQALGFSIPLGNLLAFG